MVVLILEVVNSDVLNAIVEGAMEIFKPTNVDSGTVVVIVGVIVVSSEVRSEFPKDVGDSPLALVEDSVEVSTITGVDTGYCVTIDVTSDRTVIGSVTVDIVFEGSAEITSAVITGVDIMVEIDGDSVVG